MAWVQIGMNLYYDPEGLVKYASFDQSGRLVPVAAPTSAPEANNFGLGYYSANLPPTPKARGLNWGGVAPGAQLGNPTGYETTPYTSAQRKAYTNADTYWQAKAAIEGAGAGGPPEGGGSSGGGAAPAVSVSRGGPQDGGAGYEPWRRGIVGTFAPRWQPWALEYGKAHQNEGSGAWTAPGTWYGQKPIEYRREWGQPDIQRALQRRGQEMLGYDNWRATEPETQSRVMSAAADEAWGRKHQATTGRGPTEDEWQWHYRHPDVDLGNYL